MFILRDDWPRPPSIEVVARLTPTLHCRNLRRGHRTAQRAAPQRRKPSHCWSATSNQSGHPSQTSEGWGGAPTHRVRGVEQCAARGRELRHDQLCYWRATLRSPGGPYWRGYRNLPKGCNPRHQGRRPETDWGTPRECGAIRAREGLVTRTLSKTAIL